MSKIFVSYSFKPWNHREAVMSNIISIIKGAIKACNWEIVDPLMEIDAVSDGIKTKIESSLRSSDAIVAEGTLLIPNVMYECGYMSSHRKPLLYLIDKSVHTMAEFDHYLKLIGISKHNPVASDLGDIEYFAYDGTKILELEYQNEVQEKLKEVILAKFSPHMTKGRVMLNSSFNSLNGKLSRMILTNLKQTKVITEQPFLAFLSGWVDQLSGELLDGNNIFKLDIDYYERCLSKFTESSRKDIFAIADLTDKAEKFWYANPDPKHTMVAERIFLLDIEDCFNTTNISRIFQMLQSQASNYPIRVGLKNATLFIPQHNHFQNAIHSMNCIIVRPNMVGRYVKLKNRPINTDRIMLQFVIDEDETNSHIQEYELISSRTIEFDSNQWKGYNEMIEALFKKYEIGKWKESWVIEAQHRDSGYFDWYEGHIRAWIKDYNEFISACHNAIFSIKATSANEQRFKVLEIGFGSGTLSKGLLEDEQIDYFGFDPALDKWEPFLKAKFGSTWESIRPKFIKGRAWDNIPGRIIGYSPFDLICGSLVLHDFYENNTSAKVAFVNMLEHIKQRKLLTSNGFLVFADIFSGVDTPNNERLVLSWRKYMTQIGKLSPKDYQAFRDGNPEMFESLSESEVSKLAKEHNYEATFSFNATRFNSPFKILILKKI